MESAKEVFERAAQKNKGVRIYLTKDPDLIGGIPVQIKFEHSEFPFMSKTLHHEGEEELMTVECCRRPRLAWLNDNPDFVVKVREIYQMNFRQALYQSEIYAFISQDIATCLEDMPKS